MSEPFLGEIRVFGFNFAPRGWAMCQGQILSIAQNTALFSLLGTMYGGNGQTTFALPDLRGRVPVHKGQHAGGTTYDQGEAAGDEQVTIDIGTMPFHNHSFAGTTAAADALKVLTGSAYAATATPTTPPVSPGDPYYGPADANALAINPGTVSILGGGQPHTNLQPYLVLNFCIALQGIFPARN